MITTIIACLVIAAVVSVCAAALALDAKSADAEPKPKDDHPDMWSGGGAL